MKQYILYAHDGSGNHGCEALVRSTVSLIGNNNKVTLISTRPEEDIYYGISDLCRVISKGTVGKVSKLSYSFFKAYLKLKLSNNYTYMSRLEKLCGANAKKGDVALSIGGDTYCYGGTDSLIEQHETWRSGKLKTVFWGCSIEPDLLTDPKIQNDIKNFDLITARETISYEALKKVNSNTVLVVDSAFYLKAKEVTLPDSFGKNGIIGINASPLVEKNETVKGIVRKNYENLIRYIIEETNYDILLIPHVIWKHDDDRIVLNTLFEKYKYTNRIILIEDSDCETLKGYISKCRLFIGSRTHATIAAYSLFIPTLVMGYSVKSRGIAKDLFGTEENYVISVQSLNEETILLESFMWIQENEDRIRLHLSEVIPEYLTRINEGLQKLKRL